MLRPFDKTIYVFRSGGRISGIPNRLTAEQLVQVFGPGDFDAKKVQAARPWLIAHKTALTLDPSGSNLPAVDPPWEYQDEVQPTGVLAKPFDRAEQAYRALNEKGWFITQMIFGVSSAPQDSATDTPEKLSPAAQQLAKDLTQRRK